MCFLNSFAKKNKIFTCLNLIFNVSNTLRGFQKLLMNTRFRPIAYHFVKKTLSTKDLASFYEFFHSILFSFKILYINGFFELLHQCNYQGIKSTFKSTFWWFSCYDVTHILARTIQFSSYLFLFKVVYYESCLET